MNSDENVIEFFNSIPNEVLSKIAYYDKEALERLCIALTLDLQLLEESQNNKEESYIS
jgi:hypothetical protein